MGSFSYACAVSGLPIESGDPVRCMLLTRNRFHPDGENTSHISDIWFPRVLPIKAKYNDYGSIEGYKEDPTWLESFKYDLFEQGFGDNTCHDTPTRKSMGFKDLLDSLQEGRVKVVQKYVVIKSNHDKVLAELYDNAQKKTQAMVAQEEERGVPTLQSIEALLKKNGVTLASSRGGGGFMVDEPTRATVRIRWSSYGNGQVKHLEKVLEYLKGFAAVIRVGSGSYASEAEIVVFPKPGTDCRLPAAEGAVPDHDKPATVAPAMIREDVWQALLGLKVDREYEKPRYLKFEQYLESIQTLATKVSFICGQPSFGESSKEKWSITPHAKWVFGTSHDRVNGLGISEQIQLKLNHGKLPVDFVRTLAEFAFIHTLLSMTRYQWRPSTSSGPQYGIWKSHTAFHESIVKISKKNQKKRDL